MEIVLEGTATVFDFFLVWVFMIIGLLFFALKAPQFIMDALGIKSKGNFVRMLGMGATALGMAGNVISQTKARNKEKPNHGLINFGASLFGGLVNGAMAGSELLSSDKPKLNTGIDKLQQRNAKSLTDIHAGVGLLDKGRAGLTSLLLGSTPLDDFERDIANAKSKASTAKQLKEYLIGEGKKKTAQIVQNGLKFTDENGVEHTVNYSLDQLLAMKDEAVAKGTGITIDGKTFGANSSVINKLIGDAEEGAGREYARLAALGKANGGIDDPGALDSFRKTLADSLGIEVDELKQYHKRDNDGQLEYDANGNPVIIDLYNNPTEIKIIEKQNQTAAFRIENSTEYDKAKKIYGKKS